MDNAGGSQILQAGLPRTQAYLNMSKRIARGVLRYLSADFAKIAGRRLQVAAQTAATLIVFDRWSIPRTLQYPTGMQSAD